MNAPFRIRFQGDGNCVPKQRAQVGSHGAYYPERGPGSKRLSYPDYKEQVQWECQRALSAMLMHDPDAIARVCNSSSADRAWGLHVTAWVGSGDFDNIAGSIADALQCILWSNDRQTKEAHQYITDTKPKEYRGVVVEAWTLTTEA